MFGKMQFFKFGNRVLNSSLYCCCYCVGLQCFDTVGWTSGRASDLWKL